MNGGYDFTDSYGNKMKSLEGMARWVPRNGFQKAGVGAYRMEAEFGTNPEYKNMRNAIQIMNPSSHTLLKKIREIIYETEKLYKNMASFSCYCWIGSFYILR